MSDEKTKSLLLGVVLQRNLFDNVNLLIQVPSDTCANNGKRGFIPELPPPTAYTASHEHALAALLNSIENTKGPRPLLKLLESNEEAQDGVRRNLRSPKITFADYVANLAQATFSIGNRVPPRTLSYERVFARFFYVLAHPAVANSPLNDRTNAIYNTVVAHLRPLLVRGIQGFHEYVAQCDILTKSHQATLEKMHPVVSPLQLAAPLLRTLEIIFERFPLASRAHYIVEGMACFLAELKNWGAKIQKSGGRGDDLRLRDAANELYVRVLRAIENGAPLGSQIASYSEQTRAAALTKPGQNGDTNEENGMDKKKRIWSLPAVRAPEATEENDSADYREISLIPTTREVTATEWPVLPGNFPFDPNAHWLPPGPLRFLDTQFRLLRRDLMTIIKPGISYALAQTQDGNELQVGRHRGTNSLIQEDYDIMVYKVLSVGEPEFEPKTGRLLFGATLVARMPSLVGRVTLFPDTLVSFICKVKAKELGAAEERYEAMFALVSSDKSTKRHGLEVQVKFRLPSSFSLKFLEVLEPLYVVESSKLMFEAYRPILQALQKRPATSVPFARIICPTANRENNEAQNEAPNNEDPREREKNTVGANLAVPGIPMYARNRQQVFDLSFLCRDEYRRDHYRLYYSPETDDRKTFINRLVAHSSLDLSQARAVALALSSEVACIQGPPGTGKTYVGVAIVQAIVKTLRGLAEEGPRVRGSPRNGPILLLCYTNHALDQFLEKLDDAGLSNMVRVGHKCSEKVKKMLLPYVRHSFDFYRARERVEASVSSISLLTDKESNSISLHSKLLMDYIRHAFQPHYHSIMSRVKDYSQDKTVRSIFEYWLTCRDMEFSTKKKKRGKRGKKAKSSQKAVQEPKNDLNVDKPKIIAHDSTIDMENAVRDDSGCLKDTEDEQDRDEPGDEEEPDTSDSEVENDYPTYEQSSLMPLKDMLELKDIWQLVLEERQILAAHYLESFKGFKKQSFRHLCTGLNVLCTQLNEFKEENMQSALQRYDIVAMTTTGAAKNINALSALNPSVLVCEEAGEILEAHLLACLVPSIQHCILIGDHKQLRPKINSHSLSVYSKDGQNYALDVSLFERLVTSYSGNEAADGSGSAIHCSLTIQRRMRPEFANFVRSVSYPFLIDHDCTRNRPEIRGIASSLFFWSHNWPQDAIPSANSDKGFGVSSSHRNYREAVAVIGLVKYILQQGYQNDQVVVLTPYVGQLKVLGDLVRNEQIDFSFSEKDNLELQKLLSEATTLAENHSSPAQGNTEQMESENKNEQRGLRISTIDNYQGEECDIVVLSLVRGVKEDSKARFQTVGFVKEANRVTVMLSRARNGLYIVGNEYTFSSFGGKNWQTVINSLQETKNIGPALQVYCQRHPENRREITCGQKIEAFAPFGGCGKPCENRLPCGHSCPQTCHSYDSEHRYVQCLRPCDNVHLQCGHPCPLKCHESCGKCIKVVHDIELNCGHILPSARCHYAMEPHLLKCVYTEEQVRSCGHRIQVKCGFETDALFCTEPCKGVLEACGHKCKGTCGSCEAKGVHEKCQQPCSAMLQCGHVCNAPCSRHTTRVDEEGESHLEHPDCSRKCAGTDCGHNKCPAPCHQPCVPCFEKCKWHCDHVVPCAVPCGLPCTRPPCDRRCEQLLECGHRCPCVCGDPCPPRRFCQQCGNESVLSQRADMITLSDYKDLNLDFLPIVVLDCGHVYTCETMDYYCQLAEYFYHRDSKNECWGKSPIAKDLNSAKIENWCMRLSFEAYQPLCCPDCKTRVSKKSTLRYARKVALGNLFLSMAYSIVQVRKHAKIYENELARYKSTTPTDFTKLSRFYKYENDGTSMIRNTPALKCLGLANKMVGPNKASYVVPSNIFESELGIYVLLTCRAALHALQSVLQKRLDTWGLLSNDRKFSNDGCGWGHVYKIYCETRNRLNRAYRQFSASRSTCRERETIRLQMNLAHVTANCLVAWYYEIRKDKKPKTIEELKLYHVKIEKNYLAAGLNGTRVDGGDLQINNEVKDQLAEVQKILANPVAAVRELESKARKNIRFVMKEVDQILVPSGDYNRQWYFCPNGHPYLIGNCGRAMVVGTCVDCGAQIGGQDHEILRDNIAAGNIHAMPQ